MQLRKSARWALPRSGAPLTIAGRRPALFLPLWERNGLPRVYGTKAQGVTPSFGSSPTWQAGPAGPELSFDGTDDYLALDPPANFNYTLNPFTWVFVFRTTSTDNTDSFVSASNNASNNPLLHFANCNPAGNPGFAFSLRDGNNLFKSVGHGTTWHRDGKPHVVIATYNGIPSAAVLHCWLDGVDGPESNIGAGTYAATTFNRRTVGALRRTTIDNHAAAQVLAFAEIHGWAAPADVIPHLTRHALSWLERPTTIFVPAAAGGEDEATGTGAQTLPWLTQEGAGGLAISGAGAQVLPALTQSAAGAASVPGSMPIMRRDSVRLNPLLMR